jgi:hypothetical protein
MRVRRDKEASECRRQDGVTGAKRTSGSHDQGLKTSRSVAGRTPRWGTGMMGQGTSLGRPTRTSSTVPVAVTGHRARPA